MPTNDETIQAAVELALVKREAEELKRQNEKLKRESGEKEQQTVISHQDLVALREKLDGFIRAQTQDDAALKMDIIQLRNHIADIESRTGMIGKTTLGRAFATWGNVVLAQMCIGFALIVVAIVLQAITGDLW